MANNIRARLVIITAPSGAGQDTVIKMFLAKHADWRLDPSVTTRAPRPGEIDGREMIFVSPEEFQTRQKAGEFLETMKVTDHWYGTLKASIENKFNQGLNVILRADVDGAMAIKKSYPKAILIFLNTESWEVLEERLRARHTESETELQHRLATNREKLARIDEFDHVVINPTGRPEQAVAEIEKILGMH